MKNLKIIARIKSDFPAKFGIPRQSNLVEELRAAVVFEPEYRHADALRGLEQFSHMWLIWGFSENERESWSPTVRPPRLGGNVRLGVFATRSPYRPNAIGLSSVRLERLDLHSGQGPVLHVLGADLMDATPIYDLKPYIPYTDCHPDAVGGFADEPPAAALQVVLPEQWRKQLPEKTALSLPRVLAQDPRPSYHHDPDRVYGMQFAGFEIKFAVAGAILTVLEVAALESGG
jgi:tRNA-Thr(GGU) m(6)t(6)A37 methyltransferase TsaA